MELTTEQWKQQKKKQRAIFTARQNLPYDVKIRRQKLRAWEFWNEMESQDKDCHVSVARLDELDRKLRAQMYKKIQLRAEITERIDAMENETESLLLRLRYIHGLKWEEVAVKMDYSWKQIHRLHSKALNNFKMT